MTPLAQYLTKQIVARPRDRTGAWTIAQNIKHLRETLHDIHCFEVTECCDLVLDTYEGLKTRGLEKCEMVFEQFAFLPAPKTWIEWLHHSGNRIGVALEERQQLFQFEKDGPTVHAAEATFFDRDGATNLGLVSLESGDHYSYGGVQYWPPYIGSATAGIPGDVPRTLLSFAHLTLVVINSPKIIGRRQHMPHRGLERQLTRGLGAGKFPLHAWTEIKLEVAKPVEIDDGEPHEAHLTGRRALHFCRKHIRIRNGQLEYVSAHWRGDPALGIKRSRYSVVP